MTEPAAIVEAQAALKGLKDFQLQTVEHVYAQLEAKGGTGRYLVADEVGLGKTLIARGVVAKTILEKHDQIPRIDVVYICSNSDIARQNINRLRIGNEGEALATRLTLLPKVISDLNQSKAKLNFISFTPATSFDLADGLGRSDERVLLYLLLREIWDLGNAAAPINVFQGQAGSETFRNLIRGTSLDEFDASGASLKALRAVLEKQTTEALKNGRQTPRERLKILCDAYPQGRSSPGRELSQQRSRFIGELRGMLAASCVKALEPDIVILDEFQRFSHLLDPTTPETQLARDLFDFPNVRVLMLSATPYKMYTPPGEESGEDHYEDFVKTVRFLEGGRPGEAPLESLLTEYREAMFDTGSSQATGRVSNACRKLEQRLRKVMVRTERLSSTEDRNGMLTEVRGAASTVTAEDALGYVALQRIARQVEHHDTVDYWKSAPYPLNFMENTDYALPRRMHDSKSEPSVRVEIAKALRSAGNHRFDGSKIDRNEQLDPGNGRLRALMQQTIEQGAHRLLWLPPSMPYYQLAGVYADPAIAKLTKRLVFTSWRFVPRSIAALISYEAERRMQGAEGSGRRERGGLLKFSRTDGRLTGMTVLALMYPSSYLAQACDPIKLTRELAHERRPSASISAADVLDAAISQIELSLGRLPRGLDDGPIDERWYWAAPLMLDMKLAEEATRTWFAQRNLAADWSGKTEAGGADEAWEDHVSAARDAASGSEKLGRRPPDLAHVLAELALGGPGVGLLRSMLRVVGLKTEALAGTTGVKIRTSAARAAWGFRTLFNQAEVISLVQGQEKDSEIPYWRAVLRYGINGCLQSVLDEYAHVLRDHLGLGSGSGDASKVHEIAEQMAQALSLRTSNLTARDIGASSSGLTIETSERRMRCHFALRFGDQVSDTGEETRADSVRKAFNSPFWPFVLATTSVGQEGLDFHNYCHAVVHWNLPTNPVDLEQREGRVHRFKGHAVRKNVSMVHAAEVLAGESVDVWEEMFGKARNARPAESTDLVPYWVFAPKDGARIERHVLALPSSREHEQMNRLARALTMYRMVFGQPRQEDMMRFLIERVDPSKLDELIKTTRVDLGPDPTAIPV